jgi:hypothetical protein
MPRLDSRRKKMMKKKKAATETGGASDEECVYSSESVAGGPVLLKSQLISRDFPLDLERKKATSIVSTVGNHKQAQYRRDRKKMYDSLSDEQKAIIDVAEDPNAHDPDGYRVSPYLSRKTDYCVATKHEKFSLRMSGLLPNRQYRVRFFMNHQYSDSGKVPRPLHSPFDPSSVSGRRGPSRAGTAGTADSSNNDMVAAMFAQPEDGIGNEDASAGAVAATGAQLPDSSACGVVGVSGTAGSGGPMVSHAAAPAAVSGTTIEAAAAGQSSSYYNPMQQLPMTHMPCLPRILPMHIFSGQYQYYTYTPSRGPGAPSSPSPKKDSPSPKKDAEKERRADVKKVTAKPKPDAYSSHSFPESLLNNAGSTLARHKGNMMIDGVPYVFGRTSCFRAPPPLLVVDRCVVKVGGVKEEDEEGEKGKSQMNGHDDDDDDDDGDDNDDNVGGFETDSDGDDDHSVASIARRNENKNRRRAPLHTYAAFVSTINDNINDVSTIKMDFRLLPTFDQRCITMPPAHMSQYVFCYTIVLPSFFSCLWCPRLSLISLLLSA